jgi:hypothetical protein
MIRNTIVQDLPGDGRCGDATTGRDADHSTLFAAIREERHKLSKRVWQYYLQSCETACGWTILRAPGIRNVGTVVAARLLAGPKQICGPNGV